MLEIEKLSAGYGSLQILSEVSVTARPRQIMVIVGPNGSGKSTLLKSIFGLTRIFSGSVRFDGNDLVGAAPHDIARKGVAYLPQVESVFPNLTVQENLKMAAYTITKSQFQAKTEEVLELFPALRDLRKRRSQLLSGGERQMLAMSMALVRSPRLIMFDEPTANLSPKLAIFVLSKIVEIREKIGPVVVLVEQNAVKALEIGDRACLLVGGQAVFEGDTKQLLTDPQLGRLYLGLGREGPVEEKRQDESNGSEPQTTTSQESRPP